MASVITKIERQKKNKTRYSLYAGDQFISGISEETLLAFDIHTGKSLSDSDIDNIKAKELYLSVREQAWRFLARREHSTAELRNKLLKKSFSREIVQEILDELLRRDYLNDRRFARLLITEEINLKKSGPLLVRGKLQAKGVAINIIDELLIELYCEEMQIKNCRYLADKKRALIMNLDDQLQLKKLYSFLTQKGYGWDIIQRAL